MTLLTTKQRSADATSQDDAKIGNRPFQLRFSSSEFDCAVPRRSRRKYQVIKKGDMGRPALLQEFYERIARRHSLQTARKYAWVVRDLLRLGANIKGRSINVLDVYRDATLLESLLKDDRHGSGAGRISGWLAAQRRTVLRSFAAMMREELTETGIGDAEKRITEALQRVAQPLGSGFKLVVGTARGRGGPTPTEAEASRLMRAMGSIDGWGGCRNLAFLLLLCQRGLRVGALCSYRRSPSLAGAIAVCGKQDRCGQTMRGVCLFL